MNQVIESPFVNMDARAQLYLLCFVHQFKTYYNQFVGEVNDVTKENDVVQVKETQCDRTTSLAVEAKLWPKL